MLPLADNGGPTRTFAITAASAARNSTSPIPPPVAADQRGLPRDAAPDFGAFEFQAATVTGLSPASGPRTGGTTATIAGTGFATATAVRFGGAAATNFTVDSDTQITAVAPAGAVGGVDVTVANRDTTSPVTPAGRFTYNAVGSLVVTTTADEDDGTADPTVGAGTSLREAVAFANTNPGADTITFAIPGSGVRTIALASALPALTGGGTTIDGLTQPGAVAGTLLVELDGAGLAADGLVLASDGNVLRGLSVTGFGGAGARVTGAGNVLADNVFDFNTAAGVEVLGAAATRNRLVRNVITATQAGPGVRVADGASGNTVGGADGRPSANAIVGNGRGGVVVGRSAADTTTVGNRILGNTIEGNAGQEIDLGADGATQTQGLELTTPNPRAFPKNGQNRPRVFAVEPEPGGAAAIRGVVPGAPNSTVRVELFSATADVRVADSFLGFVDVTTNAVGQALFEFAATGLSEDRAVYATATSATGDTSEQGFAPSVFVPVTTGTTLSAPATVVYGSRPAGTVTVTSDDPDTPPAGTVTVFLGGQQIAQGAADADGRFAFAFAFAPGGGSYTLSAAFDPDDERARASSDARPLTVTPVALTIRADDAAGTAGQPLPPLTASYAGFVNGDTPGSLTAGPVLSTTATPSSPAGSYTIDVSGAASPNYAIAFVPGTLTLAAVPLPPARLILTAVGAGPGAAPAVKVFDAAGNTRQSFFAYAPDFTGGVRVATADFTGDGVDDILTGAGPLGSSHVRVYDGVTGAELRSFFAFDPAARYGVFVAAADLDGDGVAEIVAGAGEGAAPHVKVIRFADLAEVASFLAFDSAQRGGVTVGAQAGLLVAGSGVGVASEVRVFAGGSLAQVGSFRPFGAFAGGVNVTADNGLIGVGAGPGAGLHVKVYTAAGAEVASLFPFDPSFARGVSVASRGGGAPRLVVGAGPGGAPRVIEFDLTQAVTADYLAFDPGFLGGVFVG